jgi:beta-barrel assembly-enhancing protease
MKSGLRLTLLILLLACGAALVASLYVEHVRSPLQSTLTSSFQLLGTPVKLLDRMASRVVPVSALDERELGDTFRKRYDAQVTSGDADQAYLDALMVEIKSLTHKPFPYRAYVIGYYGAPNAMALPGGVILVTKELLGTLHSESELVAVLAHEVGHIERGHCFDTVRFQLLTRKIGSDMLGALADAAAQILLRHVYSKTTEGEADEYAYELLVSSRYDPLGVSKSFGSLRRYTKSAGAQTPQHAHPIRDYFMSHPPLEIREAEFNERAAAWWKKHAEERRYVGQQNLLDRKALGTIESSGEWASGAAWRR